MCIRDRSWTVNYKDLKFNLKLMGFKHTGLFPEQAYNWDLIRETIKNTNHKCKVLNLFAYTGAASIAALKEGAEVVHVDASRGMIDWAKENVKVNNLENEYIRFLNGMNFNLTTSEKIVRVYFNDSFKGLGKVENNIMKRFIVL